VQRASALDCFGHWRNVVGVSGEDAHPQTLSSHDEVSIDNIAGACGAEIPM